MSVSRGANRGERKWDAERRSPSSLSSASCSYTTGSGVRQGRTPRAGLTASIENPFWSAKVATVGVSSQPYERMCTWVDPRYQLILHTEFQQSVARARG